MLFSLSFLPFTFFTSCSLWICANSRIRRALGWQKETNKTASVTADLKDNQSRLAVLGSILPLTDKYIFSGTVLMSDGRECSLSFDLHPVLAVLTVHWPPYGQHSCTQGHWPGSVSSWFSLSSTKTSPITLCSSVTNSICSLFFTHLSPVTSLYASVSI